MNNIFRLTATRIKHALGFHDIDVVCKHNGAFGKVTVFDTTLPTGSKIRVLDVAGTWQSATYFDDDWADLVFPYHRLYNHALRDDLLPRRVLMLGGGGYSYPKHLLAYEPVCEADVVEPDPLMTQLAYEHFFLERLDTLHPHAHEEKRLHSYQTDGRTFIEQAPSHTYDYIFNDCFAAKEPAHDLMTQEAARTIKRILTPQGAYASNVVGSLTGASSRTLRDIVATLSTEFSTVLVLPCGADEPQTSDNNVVIATNAPWNAQSYELSPSPAGRILTDARTR